MMIADRAPANAKRDACISLEHITIPVSFEKYQNEIGGSLRSEICL